MKSRIVITKPDDYLIEIQIDKEDIWITVGSFETTDLGAKSTPSIEELWKLCQSCNTVN
jgi:hypothetical protein